MPRGYVGWYLPVPRVSWRGVALLALAASVALADPAPSAAPRRLAYGAYGRDADDAGRHALRKRGDHEVEEEVEEPQRPDAGKETEEARRPQRKHVDKETEKADEEEKEDEEEEEGEDQDKSKDKKEIEKAEEDEVEAKEEARRPEQKSGDKEAEEEKAGKEDEEKPGKEGEEEGGKESEEEDEEEEHVSEADIEVSCMLLGGVALVIILFILVNWWDDDIRYYAWKIISVTISIFTAVLMFSGISDVVRKYFEDSNPWTFCLVQFVHCLAYIAVMQVAIAVFSGVICYDENVNLEEKRWIISDALRCDNGRVLSLAEEANIRNVKKTKSVWTDDLGIEVPVSKRRHQLDYRKGLMKCYATLLAHMSGFAAINAGATMQQMHMFSSSPEMSFLAVLLNQSVLQFFFQITLFLRQSHKKRCVELGLNSMRADLHNEEVQEAENDISSLSMSFLMVQALRLGIFGVLPNEEGTEVPEVAHSMPQVWTLYISGVGFAFLSVLTMVVSKRIRSSLKLGGYNEEEVEESPLIRTVDTMLNTFGMGFAWCNLFATRYVFLATGTLDIETVMGRVVMALTLSTFVFIFVFFLDKIDDATREADEGGEGAVGLKIIINALSILVGFSWEHCFDGAVFAIASTTRHPDTIKFAIAVLVFALLVPTWKSHILTKVMELEDRQRERKKREQEQKEAQQAQKNPTVRLIAACE